MCSGVALLNEKLTCYKTLLTECHCPDLLQYSITVFKEKNIYLVVTEKIKRSIASLGAWEPFQPKFIPVLEGWSPWQDSCPS